MIDYDYIDKQMREVYNLTQKKVGFSGTSKFDDLMYRTRFFKVIEENQEFLTTLDVKEKLANLKDNLDKTRYEILKIDKENEKHDNAVVYIREFLSRSKNSNGGLVTIELADNRAKISTFQHNTVFNLYNSNEVFELFKSYLENNTIEYEVDKEIRKLQEEKEEKLLEIEELNGDVSVRFPLDKEIYLQADYIHPSILFKLSLIKEKSIQEYEYVKRSVVNNNKMMNRTNSYHRELVGTNKYHELEFPVIGVKPDLEEFTAKHVWDDEKFYYHSRAKEYIPYDIPDHYISNSARFGAVNIGNISKISGKKEAGWGAIQKGEFYITERQLIIFDKGPSKLSSLLNVALNADTYKRSVYWFTWSEIDYVEGNIKEGTLLISTSQDKHKQHKFIKINESNQNVRYTEDELRYLVNLIGSLIEKNLR